MAREGYVARKGESGDYVPASWDAGRKEAIGKTETSLGVQYWKGSTKKVRNENLPDLAQDRNQWRTFVTAVMNLKL